MADKAIAELEIELPTALELAPERLIAADLGALMHDYTLRLAQQRVLSWFDFETYQQREWSAHLSLFKRTCTRHSKTCWQLLAPQLVLLRQEFNQSARVAVTLRVAVVLSALTDLCAIAESLPLDSDTYSSEMCAGIGVDGPAAEAARAWALLGYDNLFAEYHGVHSRRLQFKSDYQALQSGGKSIANAQRDGTLSMANLYFEAQYAESVDELPYAFSNWLMIFLKAATTQSNVLIWAASQNMARIAFLLGDVNRGNKWHEVAQDVLAQLSASDAALSCEMQVQRQAGEFARQRATHAKVDRVKPIRDLSEQGCEFTPLAPEQALGNLRDRYARDATAVLDLAIKACNDSGRCAKSRQQHLEDVLTIARGQLNELEPLFAKWLAVSKQGQLNGVERRITWALANALAAHPGGKSSALRLYEALDEQIHFWRSALTGVGDAHLRNLARYDELSRLRVKYAAIQGEVLWFGRTESLRTQSLLRRLRLKRWEHEFAGISDPAAQSRLDASLATQAALRKSVTQHSAGKSDAARTLSGAMLAELDGAEAQSKEQYLQSLASRKAEKGGLSRRPPWLSMGDTDLLLHERSQSPGVSFSSLGPKEAYLSWLRVPGGYVGTLATPDPQNLGRWGTHRLVSHFVPVTAAKEASFELYRKLLESGAGNKPQSANQGGSKRDLPRLTVNDLPVWRQTDGSFIASAQPATGAVPVNSLVELSDALYTWLLAPFESDLRGVNRLVVSPDGELAYLAFESLTRSGTRLLDTFDFAYVQSLAVHEELTARAHARTARSPTLLSFADPDYSPSVGAVGTGQELPPSIAGLSWKRLRGTRVESAALLRLFPGSIQRVDKQASRKELAAIARQGALSKFSVLHFATHSYVDDERSALVLSMADGVASAYLQDTDVLAFKLNSDLVLLSACNTALGRDVSGEGIMGLPYAFLLAGNSNTLMTLWSVDDAGTAAFVARFMAKVRQGADLLNALNTTKREFARGDHGAAFANPRIWAAFVQYGVGLALHK